MPFVHIRTNAEAAAGLAPEVLAELSRVSAAAIGKSEAYVQVAVEPLPQMLFGGEPGPTASVNVTSIGMTDEVAARTTEALFAYLSRHLGVPPARVYLNFHDIGRPRCAWNGKTFG